MEIFRADNFHLDMYLPTEEAALLDTDNYSYPGLGKSLTRIEVWTIGVVDVILSA